MRWCAVSGSVCPGRCGCWRRLPSCNCDAYIAAHDAKYTYWRLRPNMADPTIVPLIPVPNHPAYVSNAAIIASAVAELVGSMFPQEAVQWQYLGEEAGLSRIYAGIHYPSDERAGNQMGKSIAALAIQRDQLNGL